MKINKIRKQGKKYLIELEDGIIIKTYGDILIKYNILYHKELDEEMFDKISKENIYYDAYNSCLTYISKKLRSEYEIEKYLNKYLISENEKNSIINKLKDLKLINDNIFALAFINDKLAFTNSGPYKIKNDLLQLKVNDKIVDDTLSNIDETIYYERVRKILDKKLKVKQKYSGNILKQKLANELKLLGYPEYIIYEEVNKINVKGNILKEYDKIYSKLSKKYEGYELDRKLNEKLYALGYTKSDIEKVTH